MKPNLFLSIMILIVIVLASAFNLHILPLDPIRQLGDSVAASALWICPKNSVVFDEISKILFMFKKQITIGLFFCLMLLMATAGWSLYQNLLKDSFDPKLYKNVWGFTKLLFWVVVIGLILMYTPNHWRSVKLRGLPGEYVMCENNQRGAVPVRSDAVIPGR